MITVDLFAGTMRCACSAVDHNKSLIMQLIMGASTQMPSNGYLLSTAIIAFIWLVLVFGTQENTTKHCFFYSSLIGHVFIYHALLLLLQHGVINNRAVFKLVYAKFFLCLSLFIRYLISSQDIKPNILGVVCFWAL